MGGLLATRVSQCKQDGVRRRERKRERSKVVNVRALLESLPGRVVTGHMCAWRRPSWFFGWNESKARHFP